MGAWINFAFPTDLAFGVPILPGYVLGSLAVLIAPWPFGALGPIICAIPTIAMWGHPWALPAALVEGFVISFFFNRMGRDQSLFIDALYWLIVGIPMTYLFYAVILHMPSDAARVEASKQGANAVFACAIAMAIRFIAVLLYFHSRSGSPPYPEETPTTRQFLTVMINVALIAPTIVWAFVYQNYCVRTALMSAERDAAVYLTYAVQDPQRALETSHFTYKPTEFSLYLKNSNGTAHSGNADPYASWTRIRALHDKWNFYILVDPEERNPMFKWLTSMQCAESRQFDGTTLVAQTNFSPYVQRTNESIAKMYIILMIWLSLAACGAYKAAHFFVKPIDRLKLKALTLTTSSDENLRSVYERNWRIGGLIELQELRDSIVLLTGTLIHRNSELREAKIEAERQRRNAERYLAFMGHEIKTPVVALKSLIDAIEDDVSKGSTLLPLASSETNSLLGLVNDILDESRIKNGTLAFAKDPFNLASDLQACIKPYRILALRRKLQFDLSIPQELDTVVRGDRIRLNQVIANLLSNSFKYSYTGKISAAFSFAETDGECMLTGIISDEGKGISPETLCHIWTPFGASGESTTGETSHGLGLSIVKAITEGQGGTISVKSEKGKGSTFTFTIPFSRQDAENVARASDRQESVASEESGERAPLAGKRILIADDQPIIRMTVRGMLECLGAKFIDEAIDGNETLDRFENADYDILILDNYMPGPGGIEVAGAIRKIEAAGERTHPFIILSSSDEIPDHPSFDASLTKPLSVEKIRACLEACSAPPTKEA